jgi:hypothetical protein
VAVLEENAMSLDLIEAPPAMPEPPQVDRDRMLGLSPSGRSYVVLEVHHTRIGPGDSKLDWHLEVFECSGWFPSWARAAQRRDQLEREGLWLSERTLDRMRRGQSVPRDQLEWGL